MMYYPESVCEPLAEHVIGIRVFMLGRTSPGWFSRKLPLPALVLQPMGLEKQMPAGMASGETQVALLKAKLSPLR